MKRQDEEAARQPMELLDYLEARGWKPARDNGRDEVRGLCPLHEESRASFYVNRRKQVFYCNECGQGGDLVRMIALVERISVVQAIFQVYGGSVTSTALVEKAARFYQLQLMRLMGHARIQTTLLYIQLSPQDVYAEYARAVARQAEAAAGYS